MTAALPRIRITDSHNNEQSLQSPYSPNPASASPSSSSPVTPVTTATTVPDTAAATSHSPSRSPAQASSRDQSASRAPSNPPKGRRSSTSARSNTDAQTGREVQPPRPEEPLARSDTQATIDPLSEQLSERTRDPSYSPIPDYVIPTDEPDTPLSPPPFSHGLGTTQSETPVKEKRKSFLTRLINNKKKEPVERPVEDDRESRDERLEGMDAELFSQPLDNIGFSPQHLQPPGYIKMRAHNKKEKEFDRLFLAQELRTYQQCTKDRLAEAADAGTPTSTRHARIMHTNAIWAMEFSSDGRFLAAAGQDKMLRIWAVLASREDRIEHERAEETGGESHVRLSAPVFQSRPVREYEGHTAAVLDLSWSKNNFLLSSSMDKTVRLWHVSRTECLCVFQHSDLVTSIQFHPRDDRFFLAGCLDSKIRLWSIPDKSVAFWSQVPDMITAVAFSPDGKTAMAGCLTGLCLFYDTDGMKHQSQISVKSRNGKNSRGSKITGLQARSFPTGSSSTGDVKLLITTNDSRVRLYNLRDKTLELKFKGHQNNSMQIFARFSDDARHVICGSDDYRAYIWSMVSEDGDHVGREFETFQAHRATTTAALFVPQKARMLLSSSEDPIYDLCNPPPVTLLSRTESDSVYSSQNGQQSHDPTASSSTLHTTTPTDTMNPPPSSTTSLPKRAECSPAYLARTAHAKGNIIVTADSLGAIKVFRQDCAHGKRTPFDDSASVLKRGSNSSARKAMSMYAAQQIHQHGRKGRSRQNSVASSHGSVDRVLSWRQSVSGGERASSQFLAGINGFSGGNSGGTTSNSGSVRSRVTRSVSPKKIPVSGGMWTRSTDYQHSPTSRKNSYQSMKPASVRADSNGDSPPPDSHPPASSKASDEKTAAANVTTEHSAPSQSAQNTLTPPDRPEIDRGDSTGSAIYWRRDAWRESMAGQLQSIRDHRDQGHVKDSHKHSEPSTTNTTRPVHLPREVSTNTLDVPTPGSSRSLDLSRRSSDVSRLSSELDITPPETRTDMDSPSPAIEGDPSTATDRSNLQVKIPSDSTVRAETGTGSVLLSPGARVCPECGSRHFKRAASQSNTTIPATAVPVADAGDGAANSSPARSSGGGVISSLGSGIGSGFGLITRGLGFGSLHSSSSSHSPSTSTSTTNPGFVCVRCGTFVP